MIVIQPVASLVKPTIYIFNAIPTALLHLCLSLLLSVQTRKKLIRARLLDTFILPNPQKPRKPHTQSPLLAHQPNRSRICRTKCNVRECHFPNLLRLKPHGWISTVLYVARLTDDIVPIFGVFLLVGL